MTTPGTTTIARASSVTSVGAVSAARAPIAQQAAILKLDRRHVTAGVVELRERGGQWAGTFSRIESPGVVAALYFGGGVRDVLLRLADGREAPARLIETQFDVTGRVYHISCDEPPTLAVRATA